MSIDYSTYVGPYVVCFFEKKEIKENRRCCPNKSCNVFGKEIYEKNKKFCDQCGSQITFVEFPKIVESVDCHEIRMMFDEALVTIMGDELYLWQKEKNMHVWIPNRHLKCDEYPIINIEHTKSTVEEIPIDLPGIQIAAFKRQFSKELQILSKAYGFDRIDYKWGIIHQVH